MTQTTTTANGSGPALPDHVDVAIVGSGFAGLGTAIKLKEAGRTDFVVLERDADVGGTWHQNTYPGCQCDVPSNVYSFSFAPNPEWSRTFALQPEIGAYLKRVADDFGVRPYVRTGTAVEAAAWDEQAQRWRIQTSRGPLTARVLVAGMGGLSEPAIPAIPGAETFAGPAFHTARWRHDVDLRGKRVAVIGTGASAVQVVPRIQPQVERLTVFQRTPRGSCPTRGAPSARASARSSACSRGFRSSCAVPSTGAARGSCRCSSSTASARSRSGWRARTWSSRWPTRRCATSSPRATRSAASGSS